MPSHTTEAPPATPRFRLPHTLVLLFSIMVLALVATWIAVMIDYQ